MPGDVLDEEALKRGERRVEGLEGAERGDVDADDRSVGQPASQIEGESLYLG